MIWGIAAGLGSAAAIWAVRPDDAWLLTRRLATRREVTAWRPSSRSLALAATVTAVLLIPSALSQVAAGAGGAVVAFALSMRRRARQRRRAREFRAESGRFLRGLSAELRAGVSPAEAARAAAHESAAWLPVRQAASGDMIDALATVARYPGGDRLRDAATAWRIAETTGAPLSLVLDRIAAGVQVDVDVDREVAMEAATARATARLMAMLPLMGVGLGMTLGVNPVRVLVATVPGVVCLVVGLALACAGVWWIERLVAGAES